MKSLLKIKPGFIIFSLLFGMNYIVEAQPTINSVTGTFNNGETLTINGINFGVNGPNLLVFDDFEDVGAVVGQKFDLSATIGNWDDYESPWYDPVYNSISRSGSFSGQLSSGGNSGTGDKFYKAGVNINFPPCTEYFLSYAVQVPENTFFPFSVSNPGIGHFPNESVWKFAWIRDYENDPDSSPGDDDKCLPTHINYANITTDGNGLNESYGASSIQIHNSASTWWQWGSWNRFAFWGKGNPDGLNTLAGQEWAQGVGDGVEQVVKTNTTDPMFKNGTAPYQWTRLHINGWIKPTDTLYSVELIYDDIYFAVGPNSSARIEIGDSSVYTNCTNLAICTPDTWSDTEILAKVREGSFDNTVDGKYLFIIDANNNPSEGFLLGTVATEDPLAENHFHHVLSILSEGDRCVIRRNDYFASMSSGNKLSIYDISGKLAEQLNENDGEFIWNTSAVHNGIYLMKLVGNQNYQGQKFVLIK